MNMQETATIPSELDWGDYQQSLDHKRAYKNFFGKSITQVLPGFFEAPLVASEDISHMSPIPFQFYVLAFIPYLMSAEVLHDLVPAAAGVDTFLWLIRRKLERDPAIIMPVMDKLLPVAEHVVQNQEAYGARVKTCGSLNPLLEKIKTLYAAERAKK